MRAADDLITWYTLRDRLRSDFIRCMEAGQPFPRIRQRMLDRAEDTVTQMEHRVRAGMLDRPTPSTTDPNPHRDAHDERRFTSLY